ncbi:MAG: recombinase family protein [Lachnospiraceae bacterium]|nr:recombinase family protein [Lachnospiraceae bacterium]
MIFDLALEGKSSYAISVILQERKLLKPTAYKFEDSGDFHVNEKCEYPYEWCAKTVRDILSNVTYIGHLYACMTAHRSFKDKRKVYIPEDQWIKRMNDHEPIIDEEVFYKVQECLRKTHKIINFKPEANIYKGLCFCGDCDHVMWFTARPDRRTFGYYSCGRSRLRADKRGCSAHYITLEQLNAHVLGEIKRLAAKVRAGKKKYIKNLIEALESEYNEATAMSRREIEESAKRIEELGILTRNLYEDRVFGRITEDIYSMLSSLYNDELERLTERVELLSSSISDGRTSDDDICRFVDLIEKYADMTEITKDIAHELIDHIVVYNNIRGRGIKGKRIEVFYRFVGKMEDRLRE